MTGAVSTINGLYSGSNAVVVTGNTGANLYSANVNVGGTNAYGISVSTSNTVTAGTVGNVNLTNVTVNGSISAVTNNYGTVTLSNVTVVGNTAATITAQAGAAGATLNGGGNITLNGVYDNSTTTTVASAFNVSTVNTGSTYTISLTNIADNVNAINTDSFVTANGGISINGITTNKATVSLTSGVAGSIATTGVNINSLGGNITLTTANGAITLSTVLAMTASSSSANSVTLVSSTKNNNITVNSSTDLNINTLTDAVPTGAYNTITITTTGNLWVPAITQNVITLTAGGSIIAPGTAALSSPTGYSSGAITVKEAGDISVNNLIGTVPQKTLSLTSTSGNVNVDAALTPIQSVTLAATSGNVNISTGVLTANGLTITAGNSITNNSTGYVVNNTGTVQTATLTAPVINLSNPSNVLPNVTLNSGSVVINQGGAYQSTLASATAGQTINIANGTSVTGNLVINSGGAISIGVNPSDSVTVLGFTTLNTLNTGSSGATISTGALSPTLAQGLSALTYNANVSIGNAPTLAYPIGGTPNMGQISVSAQGTGVVTSINTGSPLNLGTILTPTLNISAPSVANTSGVVSVSGNTNVIAGTGSVQLGSSSAQANVASLNLISAGSLTLNDSATSAVYANGNNLSAINIIDTGISSGTTKYIASTGTVGTVSIAATNNVTYTVPAGTLSGGSISGQAGVTANSTGLGAVTFNLGTAGNSTILNNGSFTLNNVINAGTNSTLTANAGINGAGNTLTLGSGINLQGTGAVVFGSGNSNAGLVQDGASAVTVNNGTTTTFAAKSINVVNVTSTYNTVAFTNNAAGNITYTSNGSVALGNVNLGTNSNGTVAITSQTGNIAQVSGTTVTSTSPNVTFTLVASSTGNNGVNLYNVNPIQAGDIINVTASGNSAIQSSNSTSLTLGSVTIMPAVGSTPNSSDLQLTVLATGNIVQSSGSSVKVWGNTQLTASGAAESVTLANGGNNFGVITVNAGTNSSTGNVSIVESATSVYNTVGANVFTATSTYGDILTSTTNSATYVTGSSVLKANNISLTNVANQLAGITGTLTLTAAGNASVVNTSAFTTLATGSTVGGNLTITDATSGAMIQDQAGTSGVTVTGIASLLATNGSINFSGTNNNFGGLVTKSTGSDNVRVAGNLVLVPGSSVSNGYFTAGGNITTSGTGSLGTYNYLTLVTNLGSVTVSNDLKVTAGLTINAPLGTVNLSGMSLSVDLTNYNGNTVQSVVTPVINAPTYVAPNP